MCYTNSVMATSSKAGAKMSVQLGLYVGSGSGCRRGDFCRGFGVLRSARKEFGRNCRTVGRNGDTGSLDSVHSNSLHEGKLWRTQTQFIRFRDVVVRSHDLSCRGVGGMRMSKFAGYLSIAGSPPNSVRPFCNHRSEERPRIITSSYQNGPVGDTEPPPLFMGNQLKRFSHFKDGNVHWCRYLEVKKDERYLGPKTSSPGTQISEDPGAVFIDDNSSDVTVICFDLETTGFSPNNDRIIEFAARDLAGGVYSTMETLVNPERAVRNEHIHKISSGMVNNAGVPKWRDVALALVDFVETRRKEKGLVILVAHNGKRFDVPFVRNEFLSCGVSMPPYWRFADSLPLAKLAMKRSGRTPLPKTSLGDLYTYYNLPPLGSAHRAMTDVNMLAPVLQNLMNDLEMNTSELLERSFSADEDLKGKMSSPSEKVIVNSSGVVDKEDNVNDSASDSSVPWDVTSGDSAGRSNEDQFQFGEVWKPSSQQFPHQGNGTSLKVPDLGGLESGPTKKIIRQHMSRAGATPLMRNPPRVVRTPAVRPKKVDVKRDIKT